MAILTGHGTDVICDMAARFAFADSARVCIYRERVKTESDYEARLFWDKCSALLEGNIIDKANRIIEYREKQR